MGGAIPIFRIANFLSSGKVEHDGPTEKILAELADAAVARGLKEVDGDIVADDRYIPFDPYPAGWSVGDLFFTFGAPVTAIAFNDNSVTITMSPGSHAGDPAVIVIDPAEAAIGFTQQITTSALGTDPQLAVVRQPGPNFLLLRGSVPLGHAPVKLDLAMTDPAETAARTLQASARRSRREYQGHYSRGRSASAASVEARRSARAAVT